MTVLCKFFTLNILAPQLNNEKAIRNAVIKYCALSRFRLPERNENTLILSPVK